MSIKRGDLVEFTDHHHANYPPADASLVRFGVAVEDENEDDCVRVRLADRTEVDARFVYASGWAGWVPDGLHDILAEIDPDGYFGDEEDYL